MQANDAEIVRVYVRESGGSIAEVSPHVSTGAHSFEIIVEAEAGSLRAGNHSPYTILLTAFDVSKGQSAATSIGAGFADITLSTQHFELSNPPISGTTADPNNISPWPAYEQKFPITLSATEATAAANHVFQYTAVLFATGTDPVVSIAQSPLFVLV